MTDWRPRLVALDVDGTLVDNENRMSPRVREAVRALDADGVRCVISTGRAVPGVMDAAVKLGFEHGHAVGSNGAIVFDYSPVRVLRAITFDASQAVREVVEQVPDALVAVEEVGVGYRVSAEFPAGELGGTITVQSLDELIAQPVTRVIVRAPGHSTEEFHRIVAELGLADTNYYIGYTAWLDIAPMGVSKASGLAFLGEHLGIDAADVLAVGDGNNDVEMLQWAGRGVAMGNAPDAVKAVADDVTKDVTVDGLAIELERWL